MTPAKPITRPFAGYVRISRVNQRQGDNFISPDVQRDTIRRLALAKGVEVAEIIEERDVSGKSSIDKRQLGALVRRIEAGELGGLIVWKISRFSRSLTDGIAVAGRIAEAKGRIISPELDSGEKMGKALLGLMLGLAEEELDSRREGWREAQQRAAERGVWPSRPPFGYDKVDTGTKGHPDNGKLVPNEHAHLVTEVFKMRAAGRSLWDCAQHIRDNVEGNNYSRASLAGLFKSKAYLGDIVNTLKDGSDAIVVKDAHPALTSRRTWELAQRKGVAPVHNGKVAGVGVLRGLATCAGCNRPMTMSISGPPERRKANYTCKKLYADLTCPAPASALVELLDGLVMPEIDKRVSAGAIDQEAMLADLVRTREAVTEAQAELDAYAAVSVVKVGAEVYGEQVAARTEVLREAIEAHRVAWAAQEAITQPTDRMAQDREVARQLLKSVTVRAGRGMKLTDRVTVDWKAQP